MIDTERTRLPRPDLMSAHFDLEPAVAASGTTATASLSLRLHHLARACSPVSLDSPLYQISAGPMFYDRTEGETPKSNALRCAQSAWAASSWLVS
jgi:hypothetical protein